MSYNCITVGTLHMPNKLSLIREFVSFSLESNLVLQAEEQDLMCIVLQLRLTKFCPRALGSWQEGRVCLISQPFASAFC